MADRVPKTRIQAASRADHIHELLLVGEIDEARTAFRDLAQWFEEVDA